MGSKRLEDEIHMTRPFRSLEEEVFLNLQRTADILLYGLSQDLKGADLSPAQYNVLRILRGAGNAGLACSDISARMVTAVPDVTRLLDRLESRGLIRRTRDDRDRRKVISFISDAGKELLATLDTHLDAFHARVLGPLGPDRLRRLNALLSEARAVGQRP